MANDRKAVWSEYHGSVDDAMHGLGDDVGGDADVGSLTVKRGIVHVSDCSYCGRQCKIVTPWPEVAAFYLGQMLPALQGRVQFVREGVLTLVSCNKCGKPSRMIIDWNEVTRWVDKGVRSNCLSPKIYEARRR